MKGISAVDRLKVLGLSIVLSVPVYWIYYFLSGLVLVTIFHMEEHAYANLVWFYIPLILGIIIFIGVATLKQGEDRNYVQLVSCVPLWLISIPIATYIIAIKDFGGLSQLLSEGAGLQTLLKSNIISLVFTVSISLFFPIIKDLRKAASEKAEKERLQAETKHLQEEKKRQKQEADQVKSSIAQLKVYELNIVPFLTTLDDQTNGMKKDLFGNCISLVRRNEEQLRRKAEELNRRAELLKCKNRVTIHAR